MCRLSRLLSAGVVAAGLAGLPLACSRGAAPLPQKFTQKIVVLGFDGLDPDLVRDWVAAGKLPHMKALIERGGIYTSAPRTRPSRLRRGPRLRPA